MHTALKRELLTDAYLSAAEQRCQLVLQREAKLIENVGHIDGVGAVADHEVVPDLVGQVL